MSPVLQGRATRMYRRHDRVAGQWFGRQFRGPETRFGPFDEVTGPFAGAVAAL